MARPVPFDLLEPIDGQNYRDVPTVDETAPRPWWLETHAQPDPDGPHAVLHRRGCGQAPNPSLSCTDEEAVDTVQRGGVVPCTVCRPERAPLWLRHSPRPG